MKYGPGASGLIWPQMFDHVFFIEYDEECVTKHSKMIHEAGYEVKVGDQADVVFLEKVKYEITRRVPSFDVIIDDGGHYNRQSDHHLVSLIMARGQSQRRLHYRGFCRKHLYR